MNKTLIFVLGALVLIIAAVWYRSVPKNNDVVVEQPVAVLPAVAVDTTHIYRDALLGFSMTFPIALSSTTDDALYRVETLYTYTRMGPDTSIPGVKFTIPRVMTTGTNLSSDSYLSVEHLVDEKVCTASAFIESPVRESQTIHEGTRSYSFASSSEAAAGNRYEEHVYVLSGSNPCLAVRYFVRYGAIENYDSDTTKEFNRTKLFDEFDAIRRSLVLE